MPIFGYSPSGIITSQVYQGNMWENKRIDSIQVGFRLESGSEIRVYLRKDLLGSWQLVKVIDWATYGQRKSCKITNKEIPSFGNFNEIQMKVELIAGSSSGTNNKTPNIGRITTFLEVVTTS